MKFFTGCIKLCGGLLLVVAVLAIGLLAFLSITEYRPAELEAAELSGTGQEKLTADNTLDLITWNIGYCGLGAEQDFFMDGGRQVNPSSQEMVETYLDNISGILASEEADIMLLQEVDRDSMRTGHLDQIAALSDATGCDYSYGPNLRCKFIPYPLPPIGSVDSGIVTLSRKTREDTPVRVKLFCPHKWPVSMCNLKRCLLVDRFPIEGSDKELVIVNLHLDAYDNGEGRIAQNEALMSLLFEEYCQGNYVIAGGDFNMAFPGTMELYPPVVTEHFVPGELTPGRLPADDWQYVTDLSSPSTRLLHQVYDPDGENNQYYIIDGFILSPNLSLENVETLDLGFAYSDHNPVKLSVKLK